MWRIFSYSRTLRDGKRKMTKSEESDYSRINLADSEDEIRKKIKKAKTDSLPIPEKIEDLKNRPEALNLLIIYSSITDSTLEKTLKEMNGKDFSKFKENLSDALISTICPIGKRIKDLNNDKSYLLKILKDGSNRARKISEHNLNKIKEIVGFI